MDNVNDKEFNAKRASRFVKIRGDLNLLQYTINDLFTLLEESITEMEAERQKCNRKHSPKKYRRIVPTYLKIIK